VTLTIPPHPEWGVETEIRVLGLGPFEPVCEGREDAYASAIHAVKRGERPPEPAAERLGDVVADRVEPADRVAIVPGHDGGRPAHLRALIEVLSVPTEVQIRRTESVPPTKEIDRDEDRWANVADTTAVPADLSGKSVLLVDDILASGASMATAAASLRAAGAAAVRGAVYGVRLPSPYAVLPVAAAGRRTN
jgi:predicted amidophosphoribosyltransferase